MSINLIKESSAYILNSDGSIKFAASEIEHATNLTVKAASFYIAGKYADALNLHIEALKIRKAVFGDNDPSRAKHLQKIACCYYSLGNYEKAISLFNKVLEITREANKPTDKILQAITECVKRLDLIKLTG
ncbi:MAG: tetratricopeptide repeat protein [Rhabdochlamydiaceae bacterium]|jgi:tetratricopeptide (TPR) repeat protein